MKAVHTTQNYTSMSLDDVLKRAEEMKQVARGDLNVQDSERLTFADRLGESLKSVADAQKVSADLVKDFEMGREDDLTKVMVAQQVSSLGFQLTLNVRNKALSAYRDIINMPV